MTKRELEEQLKMLQEAYRQLSDTYFKGISECPQCSARYDALMASAVLELRAIREKEREDLRRKGH